MTTYTVNIGVDIVDGNYGQLSLREAVNLANATTAADTIEFAPLIEGQTLTLTGGEELALSQNVLIDGDSNNDGVEVAIDADGSRILNIVGTNAEVQLALVKGAQVVVATEKMAAPFCTAVAD